MRNIIAILIITFTATSISLSPACTHAQRVQIEDEILSCGKADVWAIVGSVGTSVLDAVATALTSPDPNWKAKLDGYKTELKDQGMADGAQVVDCAVKSAMTVMTSQLSNSKGQLTMQPSPAILRAQSYLSGKKFK